MIDPSASTTVASGIRRNSLRMGIAYTMRAGAQAIYFILIARTLGAREYGRFVAVLALISVFSPFASIGFGGILVSEVSRQPSALREALGRAISATALSGATIGSVIVIASPVLMRGQVPMMQVGLLCGAELLCGRTIDVLGQSYQAVGRLDRMGQFLVAPQLARLLAVVTLSRMAGHNSASDWIIAYSLAVAVTCLGCAALTFQELGTPILTVRGLVVRLREGIHFAVGLSAQTVYNDADKYLLGRTGTDIGSGIYASAYRLADVAFTPTRALLQATFAQFFVVGEKGVRSSAAYARRLLRPGLALSASTAVLLFALAPIAPVLLGQDFREVVPALRFLALLPVLQTTHYFAANALTGAGYQSVRTRVQIAVALINVPLTIVLIQVADWRGAAVASLITDALLAITLWMVIRHLEQQDQGLQSVVS